MAMMSSTLTSTQTAMIRIRTLSISGAVCTSTRCNGLVYTRLWTALPQLVCLDTACRFVSSGGESLAYILLPRKQLLHHTFKRLLMSEVEATGECVDQVV